MPTDRPPAGGPDRPVPETPVFVDANIFLRYLTNDVPEQADAVEAFLDRAASGEIQLVTSVLVIAEVVWTLGSFYKRTKEQVRDAVLALCHTPGLDVEDADGLVQAAEWHAEKNVDFADAYHAAWMISRGLTDVRTFNLKHFRRFDALTVDTP
ncbi:MAG: PIN domain-containing protein [Sandaracinaceae bacterium]